MIQAARIHSLPDSGAAGRTARIILKSVMSLAGAALAYISFACCISFGIGAAIVATAILLIPLYILEDGFGITSRLLRFVKTFLFPSILSIMIGLTLYQACLRNTYLIPNQEYNETWGGSHVF